MKFSELERKLLSNGFECRRVNGASRFYFHPVTLKTTKMDYHGSKEVPPRTLQMILKQAGLK